MGWISCSVPGHGSSSSFPLQQVTGQKIPGMGQGADPQGTWSSWGCVGSLNSLPNLGRNNINPFLSPHPIQTYGSKALIHQEYNQKPGTTSPQSVEKHKGLGRPPHRPLTCKRIPKSWERKRTTKTQRILKSSLPCV